VAAVQRKGQIAAITYLLRDEFTTDRAAGAVNGTAAEPGSVGAENLWENLTPPPPTPEWQPWTYYAIGTVVTYNSAEYQCRQSHTSQPGWEPPNVLALWLPL